MSVTGKEVQTLPLTNVHRMEKCLLKSAWRKLEDIIFTEADAKWVHHLHSDALVITTRIANSNIYRILVDNGSAIDIIYPNAYKKDETQRK